MFYSIFWLYIQDYLDLQEMKTKKTGSINIEESIKKKLDFCVQYQSERLRSCKKTKFNKPEKLLAQRNF
jgi:hypothetical protein